MLLSDYRRVLLQFSSVVINDAPFTQCVLLLLGTHCLYIVMSSVRIRACVSDPTRLCVSSVSSCLCLLISCEIRLQLATGHDNLIPVIHGG